MHLSSSPIPPLIPPLTSSPFIFPNLAYSPLHVTLVYPWLEKRMGRRGVRMGRKRKERGRRGILGMLGERMRGTFYILYRDKGEMVL